MNSFKSKTALITGAAGDIGAATAAAFAKAGANIVLTDRRADALTSVAEALASHGVEVMAHACDQTDPLAVGEMFAAIKDRFNGLDAAFINAGYGRKEIAETIVSKTGATGAGVIIEAQHMCMMMRGVEKQNSVMTTSCMLGAFRNSQSTRNEFLSLISK